MYKRLGRSTTSKNFTLWVGSFICPWHTNTKMHQLLKMRFTLLRTMRKFNAIYFVECLQFNCWSQPVCPNTQNSLSQSVVYLWAGLLKMLMNCCQNYFRSSFGESMQIFQSTVQEQQHSSVHLGIIHYPKHMASVYRKQLPLGCVSSF